MITLNFNQLGDADVRPRLAPCALPRLSHATFCAQMHSDKIFLDLTNF